MSKLFSKSHSHRSKSLSCAKLRARVNRNSLGYIYARFCLFGLGGTHLLNTEENPPSEKTGNKREGQIFIKYRWVPLNPNTTGSAIHTRPSTGPVQSPWQLFCIEQSVGSALEPSQTKRKKYECESGKNKAWFERFSGIKGSLTVQTCQDWLPLLCYNECEGKCVR